jgi:hypothetical protein
MDPREGGDHRIRQSDVISGESIFAAVRIGENRACLHRAMIE